ncbi:hypothetical protein CPB85DRAFT_1432774 [Mucidula mucida]|nr:hypothetical protein CPB85DRAFT_1432774 [Mucidula mucida]
MAVGLFLPFVALGAAASSLAPPQFTALPLGEIRPTAWLYDQLVVQTDGVAGHMHEFYDLVKNTDWWGGDSYYSYLEEAGSYWFNAMVPNSVLVNNTELILKTYDFLEYVLDHQDETGWLGPEVGTEKPRFLWGRYPFFFGAIQLVEVDPSLTDRVVDAMHRFVKVANKMLKRGEGVDDWAATRWEDLLYDNHPEGQEELLVDTMILLKWTGAPWETIFAEEYFPTVAVETLENPFGQELFWHGVNMAEGMKALPATYRFTHNASGASFSADCVPCSNSTADLDAASKGWDLMAFGADEMLSGLAAARGSELCLVVELMFSGSYLYQVSGDLKYADRVERVTYVGTPIFQQQNQIAAKNMTPNPFPEDGSESNIFGLEPNYPCCTVNFPQGWPKFITNAFVTTPDRTSLVHVYLGPFHVSTILAGVETQYPFSDVLVTTVTATKPFMYYVRIPSWITGGSFALDDEPPETLKPLEGLLGIYITPGKRRITLALPSPISIESRPNSSVAIHRGPLNYAFDIERTETVIKTDPREAHAVDLQLDPVGAWQYAIDPSTAKYHYDSRSESNALPSPIWESGRPPVSISVLACLIDWPLAGDTFPADPPEDPECVGEEKIIALTPYGATKLRISEFPVFKSKGLRGSKEISAPDAATHDYVPTEKDIHRLRNLFFSTIDIPSEIIEIIVDMAEYWPSVHSERFLDVAVKSEGRQGSPYPMAEWCYLVSPRVPSHARSVKAVTIQTESCDQGWGGEPEHRGTRNGSWTWFEAAIIRLDDDSVPWWVSEVENNLPVDLYREGLERSLEERNAAVSCEVPSPTWIVHDVHGERRAWTTEDPKDIDNDIPPGHRHARGIYGREADFVDLMQGGDRVALLVMAKFPLWTNHVRQASITVQYSI